MKNFEKMSTKKLQALLSSANEEEAQAIQAVLDSRVESSAEKASTPVEEATDQKSVKKAKITEEERNALIEQLKSTVVGHRCEVLPMGCPEWVGGVITSVMNDKRATNILLTIKTDDGRTVRKMHNAATLRVSDEIVELPSRVYAGRKAQPKENTPWDTLEEEMAQAIENVGRAVTFQEFNQEGFTTGRIMGVVPDKRVKKLLYRIVIAETNKTVHKVTTANLKIEDSDEESVTINEAYKARREKMNSSEPLTLAQKIAKAELDLQKSQERFVALQAKIEAQKVTLAELHAQAETTVEAAESVDSFDDLI